jgi:S1-C subfamily serine protease
MTDNARQTKSEKSAFPDNAAQDEQSVVQVRGDINLLGLTVNQRLGSGFFVENQDPSKCIAATTTHLARPEGVTVRTADGASHNVSKVTRDNKTDIAFLEISDLPISQCHKLTLSPNTAMEPGSKGDVKMIGAVPTGYFDRFGEHLTGMQIETVAGKFEKHTSLPASSGATEAVKPIDVYKAHIIQQAFGGAPVISDGTAVGMIRGGDDQRVMVIPAAKIAEALKDNNL